MNSLSPPFLLSSTAIVVVIAILHLLSPSSCFSFHQQKPSDSIGGGLVFVEKTRLGSTPLTCYNKCNHCHPCMAVQVPIAPIQYRVRPGQTRRPGTTLPAADLDSSSPPTSFSVGNNNNKYSNYKPLGWKCRCGDHFYSP